MVSKAGNQQGYKDEQFPYFFDLIRCINHLIKVQPYPPIFVLENTYPFDEFPKEIQDTTVLVKSFLGYPAVVDACSIGSNAHRVRCLWTNFIPPHILELVIPATPPLKPLTKILDLHHQPTVVTTNDTPPRALVDRIGQPRMAMPTIVSYPRNF